MTSSSFCYLFLILLRTQALAQKSPATVTTALPNKNPTTTSENGVFSGPLTQEYWVQTDLQVQRIVDLSRSECKEYLEGALARVCSLAFRRQQARHLGREGLSEQEVILEPGRRNLCLRTTSGAPEANKEKGQFEVEILNMTRNQRSATVSVVYTVWYREEPVLARIVVDDLKLIPEREMSAHIGFTVLGNSVYMPLDVEENSRLWIIAVVIGGVLAVLLFGWCILFAYYNTCGRAFELSSQSMKVKDQRVPTTVTSEPITAPQQTDFIQSKAPERIVVKEQKVQTDRLDDLRLASQLENYLEDAEQEKREPYYSTVAKTPKFHKAPISKKWQKQVDRALLAEKAKKAATLEKGRQESDPSLVSMHGSLNERSPDSSLMLINQEKPVETKSSIDSATQHLPEMPVALNPADLNDPYWTWHKAGDQVEQLFHIKQFQNLVLESTSNHPRPRPSQPETAGSQDGGTLSFHSKEFAGLGFQGKHLTPEIKEKLIRDQYLTGLNSLIS